MTIQSISKLDAATRQLDLATNLYFKRADLLGVITLAGAAHQLLADLLCHDREAVRQQPKPPRDLIAEIAAAKNFLKHADGEPKGVLTANENWPDYLIYDAIRMRLQLANELTTANSFFLIWITVR